MHHLLALHLRGGSALPHPVGLQPQAAALAARRAPEEEEEEVQALGADVAGTRGGLIHQPIKIVLPDLVSAAISPALLGFGWF